MSDADSWLGLVLDSLKEPIFIINGDFDCLFANQALLHFLGAEGDGIKISKVEEFWPKVRDCDLNVEGLSSEFLAAGAEPYSVKLGFAPIEGNRLVVRVIAGVSKNETLHSFHAQRLETLGMLAGGIAHDFNNILAGILGHITYLKTILPQTGAHVESVTAIEDGARKASGMTQQILNFSKLDAGEKAVPIEIMALVHRVCSLLRRAISPEYVMEWKSPKPGQPQREVYVLAGEARLAQIIANLVINARDALSSGGSIKVQLDCLSIENAKEKELISTAFCGRDLSSRWYAKLSVIDNGHGMPPEIIARIFEPYFSTKKAAGTGLGLATCDAIVKQFGGVIQVHSEVGSGTDISVFLPVVGSDENKAQTNAQPKSSAGALLRGHERILVVDDEYPVRNVLAMSLEHLGYQVTSVASGIEAIELYSTSKDGYDLVILDMLMPELTGEKVFFRLREIDPGARVLIISGFSSQQLVLKILREGGKGFIQKPFTISELSKQVRECLESE